ncbi:MAG: hypothetical protein EBX70_08720, partial [Betaproteobacteria bacterium]|nr:hypothetical protein [Betaproteobacteria bacterium]
MHLHPQTSFEGRTFQGLELWLARLGIGRFPGKPCGTSAGLPEQTDHADRWFCCRRAHRHRGAFACPV